MHKNTSIIENKVRSKITEGEIGSALKVLEDYINKHVPDQLDNLLLLQASFQSLRFDYNVKHIISREEFDKGNVQIIVGVDLLLKKISKTEKPGLLIRFTKYLFPLLAFLLTSAGAYILWQMSLSGSSQISETTKESNHQSSSDIDSLAPSKNLLQDPSSLESISTDQKNVDSLAFLPSPNKRNDSPAPRNQNQKINKIADKIYLVKILLPARLAKAEILVDGQNAILTKDTPIIKTIEVKEKEGLHYFSASYNGHHCQKRIKITENNQVVNLCN